MDNKELLVHAKSVLKNSYSPYSEFKVGAALLTAKGEVYTGCNVENASYGATICAERTAILKAVSDGERDFLKIAIVSESDNEKFVDFAGDFTFPCGICVQVMTEFMKDAEVILENKLGEIKVIKVKDLAPFSFSVNS